MKNKKGFTLIELLAVIVILAIIALIATPIILNMITKARKNAARSSALGYIDAIEYNNGFASIGTEGYTAVESGSVTGINVKLKGQKPTSGTITVDKDGRVTKAENLCINGYIVNYDGQDATVGNKCDDSESSTPAVTWNTYLTISQTSGSTLPAGSQFWIQGNTSTDSYELCGIFPNGTVCFSPDLIGETNDFDSSCTAQDGSCTVTGYALQKQEEMQSKGATSCGATSTSAGCFGADGIYCAVGNSSLTCYTSNFSNNCSISKSNDHLTATCH